MGPGEWEAVRWDRYEKNNGSRSATRPTSRPHLNRRKCGSEKNFTFHNLRFQSWSPRAFHPRGAEFGREADWQSAIDRQNILTMFARYSESRHMPVDAVHPEYPTSLPNDSAPEPTFREKMRSKQRENGICLGRSRRRMRSMRRMSRGRRFNGTARTAEGFGG